MSERTIREELNVRIIRHYAEQGKIAALGWTAFKAGMSASGTKFYDPSHEQMTRDAFYMGIQHCYSTLMQTAGEGTEEEDFKIMESFTTELHFFLQDFMSRNEVFAKANKINMADMELKKTK